MLSLRRSTCFLLFAVLSFIGSLPLRGDVTGSILGVARDTSGGVLSAVTVTATNVETDLKQSARTDSNGEYRILALPVGKYKVEASLTGFQTFVTTGIDLTVNEQRRVDIVLQLGSVAQSVEVKATALQVETTNTQLGEVVSEKKLLTLPLNGRSYIDLLGLQPGVVPTTSGTISQDRPVSGELAAGNISVNGGRETTNSFLVNGGDVNEDRNMGTAIIPNLDSVAEFRLITNSFDGPLAEPQAYYCTVTAMVTMLLLTRLTAGGYMTISTGMASPAGVSTGTMAFN